MEIFTVDIAAEAAEAKKAKEAALRARLAEQKAKTAAEAEEAAPEALTEPEEPVVTVDIKPKKTRARQKTAGRSAVIAGASVVLSAALLFGGATLAMPKRTFSENENRVLAAMPEFSFSALWDGSFRTGFEAWFADHFAGRDTWSALHHTVQTAAGRKDSGGVYLGKEDHLFLIPTAPDAENVKNLTEAINAFTQAYGELNHYFAVAPNAIWTQRDLLPANTEAPDQQVQLESFTNDLENVNIVDLCAMLFPRRDEYIYYLTDHHWTTLGAKYAFDAIAAKMDLRNLAEKYDTYVVSEQFEGTLASKSGIHNVRDTIEIRVPKTDIEYYVYYADSGESAGSMYQRSYLDTKDQYAVFFGGNHALVQIRTTADTGRKLLVFKDSYANAVMQFLYPYFDEIIMVDPRYYYDSLKPVMNQYGVTDVLYLYNADTFFNDTSLADVLTEAAEAPAEPAPGSESVG